MSDATPEFSEQDMASVLRYPALIDLMAGTLCDFSGGLSVQPVRQMLEVEARQRYLGVMAAELREAMGAKLVYSNC